MSDVAASRVRERIWITKLDHTTEPPRVIEELFVENGVVLDRRVPLQEEETSHGPEDDTSTDAAAVAAAPGTAAAPVPGGDPRGPAR